MASKSKGERGGKARTKQNGKPSAKPNADQRIDLEAIGLVLLALGVVLLGFMLPSLPTGDLGRQFRAALGGRIGLAAWALPWPLLVLGGLFLLRRSPAGWPRVLLGYLTLAFGGWCLLMLAAPPWSGSWGMALRAALAGAAGWLAFLPALLLVTLGVEWILAWPPTRIVRRALVTLLQGGRQAWRSALDARSRVKARAEFHADVALARKALHEIDKDLVALATLYPGSAELERWREAVAETLGSLGDPTPEALDDAEADVKAWRAAVRDFARDRAGELAVHFKQEGVDGFDGWVKGVKAALGDPLDEPLKTARALDRVRKALALDLTALAERHRRLTRARDLATAELKKMTPRQLAVASDAHHGRLQDYLEVEELAAALEVDTDALEGWRELSGRLLRLHGEFPDDPELTAFDGELAAELRKHGRALLEARDAWLEELDAVELRARQRAAEAASRAAAAAAAAQDEAHDADEAVEAGAADAAERGAADADAPDVDPFARYAEESGADDPFGGGFGAPHAAEAGVGAGDGGDASRETEETGESEETGAATADATAGEDSAALLDEAPFDDEDGEVWLEPGAPKADKTPPVGGIPIQLPELDLLDPPAAADDDPSETAREVQGRVKKIDETLSNFNLQGRVVSSVRGPTVTRFEVEPAPGEKISRFANLSDDLALAMAVGSVRIEAPIPGKSVIGLEVPNANRDLIRFRESAEAGSFRRAKARLPLILGKSIDGDMVVADLAKMPHLLIAGSTGSGKSVAVNTLIGSLLYKFLPTELRFLMIDPKMVELTPFDGVPHLLRPVVTNPNDAAGVLLGAVAHMERRYKMMSKIGAKNLDQYNEKARNLDMPEMPFIAIIIDELADLMITSPKEVESAIMRLAQMARATGMHLILATQRPSVDILTSLIKVNVPARIAFAVSSGHDSRTILDSMGAERLIGMGDMLFYQPGLVKPMRLQGPFISESEIASLAAFMRRQFFDDDFVEAYGADFDPPSLHESDASGLVDWNDDKLRDAAEMVINEGQASVSRLQRRLQVGHARAGKLMDSLEALGVVGPHVGSKPREVLVEIEELPNLFGK